MVESLLSEPPPARLVTHKQQGSSATLTKTIASADGKAVFYATFDSAPYETGRRRILPPQTRDLDTGADKELYRAEGIPSSVLDLKF
jgi:hypothetical protein